MSWWEQEGRHLEAAQVGIDADGSQKQYCHEGKKRPYGDFYKADILKALLDSRDLGVKKGFAYRRQLSIGSASILFRRGMPQDRLGAAQHCWAILCQQEEQIPAMLYCRHSARAIANVEGAIPPHVSRVSYHLDCCEGYW